MYINKYVKYVDKHLLLDTSKRQNQMLKPRKNIIRFKKNTAAQARRKYNASKDRNNKRPSTRNFLKKTKALLEKHYLIKKIQEYVSSFKVSLFSVCKSMLNYL